MPSSTLPASFQPFFPSVAVEKTDVERDKYAIIREFLQHGTIEVVKWMFERYSKNDIIHVLKTVRYLRRKDAEFWTLFFHVPRSEVRCLNNSSQMMPNELWNY